MFLGVYKALYDYEPQTTEELAIREDDLLYLLEKSDVDEWWTVKKRVIGSDAEEPVGLVPSNYVEPALVIGLVRALYDYDTAQNPDEELTFQENEEFELFDDKDPDWLLVKQKSTGACGFIPGNYVEPASQAGPAASAASQSAPVPAPVVAAPVLEPPPQHPSKSQSPEAPVALKKESEQLDEPRRVEPEEEDIPPPKPTRPVATNVDLSRDRTRSRVSYSETYQDEDSGEDRDNDRAQTGNGDRGLQLEYRTWSIAEVDGRKKRKCKLSIGNNRIYFQPQKGTPEEWTIDKLTSYDNEKKHMFLEFIDPYKSLELHTGNNDTCNEIMAVIGEYKGASRDAGLREVEMASKTKKEGNVLYDFIAESQDELTVKQGQSVYILNDKKSRDWWMCELVASGKRGVVPAQFIEPVKEKDATSGGLLNSIKKFTKSKSPSKPSAGSNWKDDEDQDLPSAQRPNRSRSKSVSSKRKRSASTSNKTDFPDPKKTRIWADRSGTFKVDAQFIGCSDGKVHLHKANGVRIAVAAIKLSDDDLIYVERVTGFSLDKYKTKRQESKEARESERERRKKLREQDERERDRRLRERELEELRKARDLLDQERAKLQDKELPPPAKPPRPQSTSSPSQLPSTSRSNSVNQVTESKKNYDWFEFFLNCGVDVSNCQRYTINFERENITEDMMKDINQAMLRTLGLREGDIVRVTNYIDQKLGREPQAQPQVPNATGGMFSKPDGSLRVSPTKTGAATGPTVAQQLLAEKNGQQVPATTTEDDAWTVKPAAKSGVEPSPDKSEFTGSMQDLLDLQPLEPKKKPVTAAPEPNLRDLEPVKTGNSTKTPTSAPISAAPTGGTSLMPLDPFKTGGHNILPMATGFVMMPIATGGLMPIQRTGGFAIPQTTFGVQNTANIMQPQRTSGGLIPIANTGGLMPRTSFGAQLTGGLPQQRTGGIIPASITGGTFNAPPLGTVLPLQKTATGLLPANTTGGAMPLQATGGLLPLQRTGGAIPQTSFGLPSQNLNTGNFAPSTSFNTNPPAGNNMMPQPILTGNRTGGMNIHPQTTFGNQMTGGANIFPQANIASLTGGANIIPQATFSNVTGGANIMPQATFSNVTGGANMTPNAFGNNLTGIGGGMPQTSFGSQVTVGFPQTSFNGPQITGGFVNNGQLTGNMPAVQSQPQMTGGFQPNLQFGTQNTGGAFNQYNGQAMSSVPNTLNMGVNGITQGLQNTSISQTPLQTQPTGFGFGNGPQLQPQLQQQQQQQSRQANLFNATADNPFGF